MIYENIYKDKLYKVEDYETIKEMLAFCKNTYGDKPAFWHKEVKAGEYKPINFITFKDDVDALGTRLLKLGIKLKKALTLLKKRIT